MKLAATPMGLAPIFNGLPLFADDLLPTHRRVQWRKPRSKSRRVQRKWARDRLNWREERCSIVYKTPHGLFTDRLTYEAIVAAPEAEHRGGA